MDEINNNNPLESGGAQESATGADRAISKEASGVGEEEFREIWAQAEAGMAQGMIFYMFPEARRIQERADKFNREMLKDG